MSICTGKLGGVLISLFGGFVLAAGLLALAATEAKANFPWHSHGGGPGGRIFDPVNTIYGGKERAQPSDVVQAEFAYYVTTHGRFAGGDFRRVVNVPSQWTYITDGNNQNGTWRENLDTVGTSLPTGVGVNRWHTRLWTGARSNSFGPQYRADRYTLGTSHYDDWFNCVATHVPTKPHETAEFEMAYWYWLDNPNVSTLIHDHTYTAPQRYYGREACGADYFYLNDGFATLVY